MAAPQETHQHLRVQINIHLSLHPQHPLQPPLRPPTQSVPGAQATQNQTPADGVRPQPREDIDPQETSQ